MPSGQVGIGYRRNGKKQACEPCRKGKLACDHGSPFCGRCVRRRTTERCIYHPAPMTKCRGETVSTTLPNSRNNTDNSPQQSPQNPDGTFPSLPPVSYHVAQVSPGTRLGLQQPTEFPGDGAPGLESASCVQRPRTKENSWKDAVFQRSSRFYGPTSFSAVFSEHQTVAAENLLDIGDSTRRHPGTWPFGEPLLGKERPNAPTPRKKEIIKALGNIPSREICETLLACPLHFRAVATFNRQLTSPRSTEMLAEIAAVLFSNEENPLPPSPEDGLEWLDTFMGPNIRFEMLGILFCFFGKAYLTLQDWDPVFRVPQNYGKDRKETAWRMKECADICRQMCHYSETINELVSALSYNIHILESVCTGDESYLMSHRHGDMVTCAITAGLHRLPDYSTITITTASEFKRRLFSTIYFLDKTHSSLNGTPPLLGRLYCDVKPCLDLTDEEMFLPHHAFSVAVSRLDPQGWNTAGNMYDISITRGIWQLLTVREEVLELALGVNILVSEHRIENLRLRCQQVLDGLPDQLLYYSDARGDGKIPKQSTGKTLFAQGSLMLDFLQNMFLIDRVATGRGLQNELRLLESAVEMLELSLMFWKKRDQLTNFTSYFDWIITFYGIPSAGVICVELLKNQHTPQQHLGFSRSDAIQKLTMFIGFLEWIRPTDGNYKLAGRLKNVIRRVLDHVLEPPSVESTRPSSLDTPFDTGIFTPFDNMNDMDWFNTIDWTQGSWIGT